MLYPVFIVLKSMLYGFILNPIREHRDLKRYLSYKGILKGTVKCNGEPLKYSKVVISQPSNTEEVNRFDLSNYHVISDKNGNFEIPHVKDGELICTAYHSGYEIFSQNFTMSNSQTINIDIELIKN